MNTLKKIYVISYMRTSFYIIPSNAINRIRMLGTITGCTENHQSRFIFIYSRSLVSQNVAIALQQVLNSLLRATVLRTKIVTERMNPVDCITVNSIKEWSDVTNNRDFSLKYLLRL